jgi:hypothetical protein
MTDNKLDASKLQSLFEKAFRGHRLHAKKPNDPSGTRTKDTQGPNWFEASRPWRDQNPDCNFYFSPVRFNGATSKKTDVKSSQWLWLDLDPREGQPLDKEREAMVGLLTWELPANVPTPTFVIDSGRGFWGLWRLKTAHVMDGPGGDATRAFEAVERGITNAFGEYADRSIINCNRIARLPGTVNLKTGTLATVVECDPTASYKLSDFPSIVVERKPRSEAGGEPLSIELIERMLKATAYVGGPQGLDDRRVEQGWRDFMMAVHEASGGDPEAASLFIAWSQDDPEYNGDNSAETIQARWDSLTAEAADGITRGSWITLLKFFPDNAELISDIMSPTAEADFDGDAPEEMAPKISAEKLAEQKARIKAQGGVDPDAARKMPWDVQCAIIVKPAAFVDVKRGYLLSNKSFDHRFGKTGGDDAHRKAIRSKLIKRYHGVGFKPIDVRSFKVNGQAVFNTYTPQKIEDMEGAPAIVIEHLRYLIPDPRSRSLFVNWLAWIVQNPDKKLMHAVLLVGNKGTGKSFFGELMKVILGAHNCSEPSRKRVASEFNGWLANRRLVIIHELREKGARGLYDELKEYITQGTTSINLKGIEAHEVDNFAAFLTITNHFDAIPIDDQERRYLVIRCADAPQFGKGTAASDAYYNRLFRCVGTTDEPGDEARKFLKFLRERKLGTYNGQGTAPETEAKAEMVGASLDGVQRFVREKLEAGEWPLSGAIISPKDVLVAMGNSVAPVLRTEGHVENCLREIGAGPLSGFGPVRTTTGRKRLWALDVKPVYATMDKKQVAATYNAAVAAAGKGQELEELEEAQGEMVAE